MDKRDNLFQTPDKVAGEYKNELKELIQFLNRQFFNQIPSVSAVAGILAGGWVMSTFTASPVKGTLARWGVIQGGTHVVSSGTYKFLAIAMPVLAAGLTAYAVQRGLKAFREMRIELCEARAKGLSEEKAAELKSKLAILETAREAGMLSWSEYRAKMLNVYQPFVAKPASKVEELIVSKVTAKIQ